MEVSRAEQLPPPPGIINSLKAGFDAVAVRAAVILFPLTLDLFLWLGPRLRMSALFNSIRGEMIAAWKSGGISPENIQSALEMYDAVIPKVNLFWLLRSIPIGVPSLPFAGDGLTPLGAPPVWQTGALGLFAWIFLLSLAGWIGGGLYFRAVSALTGGADWQPVGVFRAVSQTVLLSLTWGVLALMVLFPLGLTMGLLAQVNPALGNFALLAFFVALMWAVVPLYFWSHGIFVRKQNFIVALWSSWRMSRFMLPTSNLFALTVFILSFGLNFLWSVPPQDSWMTLVGVFGHAFVSTALLASSFIYYREMNDWLDAALEKYKANRAAPRI